MTVPTAQATSRTAQGAGCGLCAALERGPIDSENRNALLDHVLGADYFELFGLPRTCDLEQAVLDARYLAISRNIHPDRFATAGDEMQMFALRASAQVNRAYAVLKDSYRRAEYVLESAGGKSAAQDKSVPGDLLAEVMMLREEIEEAKDRGDAAALGSMRGQILERKKATEDEIARLCGAVCGSPTDAVRDGLRHELNALKYFNNLLAELPGPPEAAA